MRCKRTGEETVMCQTLLERLLDPGQTGWLTGCLAFCMSLILGDCNSRVARPSSGIKAIETRLSGIHTSPNVSPKRCVPFRPSVYIASICSFLGAMLTQLHRDRCPFLLFVACCISARTGFRWGEAPFIPFCSFVLIGCGQGSGFRNTASFVCLFVCLFYLFQFSFWMEADIFAENKPGTFLELRICRLHLQRMVEGPHLQRKHRISSLIGTNINGSEKLRVINQNRS